MSDKIGQWMKAFGVTALVSLGGCADQNCHMGEHVGGYEGDHTGVVTLEISRVDEENLVDVTLDGDGEGFPLTAQLEVESALEDRCGDLSFEGPLVNADGEEVGEFAGVLTTTTGEGTWSLTDGPAGAWALGTR